MTDPRETAAAPGAGAAAAEAAARLARLGEEFFQVVHSTDPFNATQLGVPGFDALVPDPSRAGAARGAERIASIERRLADIDAGLLGEAGRTMFSRACKPSGPSSAGACSGPAMSRWPGRCPPDAGAPGRD